VEDGSSIGWVYAPNFLCGIVLVLNSSMVLGWFLWHLLPLLLLDVLPDEWWFVSTCTVVSQLPLLLSNPHFIIIIISSSSLLITDIQSQS
jgi:hypothetical protein